MDLEDDIQSKSFVGSVMSCDCFEIQEYLDRHVKEGLPTTAEVGEYTFGEPDYDDVPIFEFVPATCKFVVTSFVMIVSEEIEVLETDEQFTTVSHYGDHSIWDHFVVEYHGLFKIDYGTKYVRVDILGTCESVLEE